MEEKDDLRFIEKWGDTYVSMDDETHSDFLWAKAKFYFYVSLFLLLFILVYGFLIYPNTEAGKENKARIERQKQNEAKREKERQEEIEKAKKNPRNRWNYGY